MNPNIADAQNKISSALEHLKSELASIRAGRANPTLLETIQINAYGSQMKLMEVGTITAPQPSLLTIQVWDQSLTHDIQKAIQEANLGLNPSIDGPTVRVPIPPLTQERREEYVKVAKNKGEESKIAVRQVRNETKELVEAQKEASEIGEDEMHRLLENLQTLVDKANVQIDNQVKEKEDDLMKI